MSEISKTQRLPMRPRSRERLLVVGDGPVARALAAALQAADVATTLHNVNGGAVEANPVMRGLVRSPAAFAATKAALATVSVYCTEKLWKTNRAAAIALMVGLNGLSAAVVARNYATRAGR
jgi:hypothetical protein